MALIACSPGGVHLEIFGDEGSIGAQVVFEAVVVGEMEFVGGIKGTDPPGSHLCLDLPNGNHVLEFRKPGYETVRMKVNVPNEREHYLYVEMKKEDP